MYNAAKDWIPTGIYLFCKIHVENVAPVVFHDPPTWGGGGGGGPEGFHRNMEPITKNVCLLPTLALPLCSDKEIKSVRQNN